MDNSTTLLSKGFSSLKTYWKEDLQAGFSVSLIALPLCLGIALASGFPPMAGLIAAIIGGLLVSRINGSFVTIAGPAAGLIVVNLGAVESLGQGDNIAGYHYALAAIVVAGVIIALFGLLKVGKLGDFFPVAAVHGMLAAIGVIIMIKQFFVAVGYSPEGHEIYEQAMEIPTALVNANPDIGLIALVTLLILILHPKVRNKFIKLVPAPMWVLIVTIPMAHYFDLFHEHHYHFGGKDYILGPKHLVQLPNNIMDGFTFPDFGKITTGVFWVAVMSIALVTAIESLLSAAAVDTLDPDKRKSNLDKDLTGLGSGSALSGLIGGLPMISEIVRSSANITYGGRTQWSNLIHGSFLLLFLVLAKPLIEQIPLAALAAMLVFTGYRLASPNEFKHVYHIGKSQLVIFVVTLLTVLATDLIIGIAAGIVTKIIIHIAYGAPLRNIFKAKFNYEEPDEKEGIIRIEHAAIFSNFISMKSEIEKHKDKERLKLDFKAVNLIDHTFTDHIYELKKRWEDEGRVLELINDDHLIPVSSHPLAAKVARKHGVKAPEIVLNERQKALKELAFSSRWEFEPSKSLANSEFENFSIKRVGKINYTENIMTGYIDGVRYVYCDLIMDSDIETAAPDTHIPALLVSNLSDHMELPHFTLEKEGFFEKVKQAAGYEDIDFKDHPEFSDYFLLKGEDEQNVRRFFRDDLIRVIENKPNFHIESNGKSVLIYPFSKDPDVVAVSELVKFGKYFCMTLMNEIETIEQESK